MSGPTRRSFLGAAAAVTSSVCFNSAAAGRPEEPSSSRASEIADLIARERRFITAVMDRDGIEGVAVSLIYRGEPAWVEGFGVTDSPGGRKIGPNTIFSIQSTSKNVTATAIMIAVQQGILDLDAPIIEYLREFTVKSRFSPHPEKEITLRLLLSNRAGFTHEAPEGNNYDPAFHSFEAHINSISETWLRYPVGERYRYSNLGFDLAGYILETASGAPFAEWTRRELFGPLGMQESTVATDEYAARKNRAVGHYKGYDTVPLRTPLISSGGVYASAQDFTAYSQFHLGRGSVGGKQLLSEALWREMHGFALGGDYGLGVIRQERRYGTTPLRLYTHNGGGFGFGSVYVYSPEAGFAWSAFFNRPSADAYRFGEELIEAILTRDFGPRRPRLPEDDLAPISLTPWQQNRWIGRYVGRNASVTISSRGGDMFMERGDEKTPLRFLSPDEAYIVDPDGEAVCYEYSSPDKTQDLPHHLECSIGEQSLDFNDGPSLPEGPDRNDWSDLLGSYHIKQWDKPALNVEINEQGGFLYLNDTRLLAPLEPRLFFTVDGEAVDFRSDPPTWKSLSLFRSN